MLIECNYCGAPLDVREHTRLTKCRYCGTTDERIQFRTVAQVTPRTFTPPPRWTPPAHVPADSSVELRDTQRSGAAGVAIVLVAVMMVGIGAGVFFLTSSGGGIGRPSGAELATLSLAQTPKGVASHLSAKASDTTVYAPVDSARFEYVSFSWKEGHPDHVESFYFAPHKNVRFDEALRTALTAKLGRPLDENGAWRWENVWLNVDLKTGAMSGNVSIEASQNEANPYWKRQITALYQIVVAITFNQNIGPTTAEAQELLGTGYAFGDLAKLDPKTPVESARARVAQRFPGSVFSTSGSLTANVAVDHPLFIKVELQWKNEKASPIYMYGFRPKPGPRGYEARREALSACLSRGLSLAPEIQQTDYLKNKKDYHFVLPTARLYMSETWLYMYADKPLDAGVWSKIIASIDACR